MFTLKGLFSSPSHQTVDPDEDMADVTESSIPGQFDPTPTRVSPVSLQNTGFQHQSATTPQGLSIGHASVDQISTRPFGLTPTATTTSTVDQLALTDQSDRPRILGRRRHADVDQLPVPPQDGNVSGAQDSHSQSHSQSHHTARTASLVKTIRSKSSKRQLSVSDKEAEDEVTHVLVFFQIHTHTRCRHSRRRTKFVSFHLHQWSVQTI